MAVIHRHPDKPTDLFIDKVAIAPMFQRQGVAGRYSTKFALGRLRGCEQP
jgi:hypothetical protein